MMSENKINFTPEAVAALNALCNQSELNGTIDELEWVEDELQKAAHDDGNSDYLYRYAYSVKLLRKKFEHLLKVLGYERELSE